MAAVNGGAHPRNPKEHGRTCDLCGGQEFSLLHEWPVGDHWNPAAVPLTIWKCHCGLAFLHPVPEPHQLPDQGEWWSRARRQRRRRGAFKEAWKTFRHSIIGSGKDRLLRSTRKAAPAGRFLDVGCGAGEMLELAAPYYEPVGLEPSPIAAALVREQGFAVAEETLEQTTLPPGSFDVILLDSVIEHVASPRAALEKVHSLLAPGGVVVLLTPKFEGPSCRLHGREWNGFRHGYHTYLFSGRTLGRYLEETGFEVLRHPRRDRMLDDILILWGRKKSPTTR
ncbi:class I SAM-dependent methyltransferase [soil metagenome]